MRVKVLAALSLLSLSATPIMAQSNAVTSAANASVERVSANQQHRNKLAGSSDTVIAVLAAAVLAAFVTLSVIDDDNDDAPVSP